MYDLLAEKGQLEEFWDYEDKGICEGAREWVIQVKGWILLNNPYGGNTIQVVAFNPLMKHTKRQLKALDELFENEEHVVQGVLEKLNE